MPASRVFLIATLFFAAGVLAGGIIVDRVRSFDSHYELGFARVDGCRPEADDRTLICSTPVGAGDILLRADVTETPSEVMIRVHSSVLIPGRNGFKNLSATLDTTRVILNAPLGQRRIVDGASGREVRRY